MPRPERPSSLRNGIGKECLDLQKVCAGASWITKDCVAEYMGDPHRVSVALPEVLVGQVELSPREVLGLLEGAKNCQRVGNISSCDDSCLVRRPTQFERAGVGFASEA